MKHNSFSNVILLCQHNLSTGWKIHHSQKTTEKACPTVTPQSRRAPQKMKKKQLVTYLGFTHDNVLGIRAFCGLTWIIAQKLILI